jgi:hypothetical protein
MEVVLMRRNAIITIIITFCFTTSMLMIIPIKSANQPYDPWLDYNDDGKIGLSDLVSLAQSYGTTGDPTKNVNVTNFPLNQFGQILVNDSTICDYGVQRFTVNFTSNGWTDPFVFCGSYSRLSILWNVTDVTVSTVVTIHLYQITWFDNSPQPQCMSNETSNFNITVSGGPGSGYDSGSYMTETKAPACYLRFYIEGTYAPLPTHWNGWITVDFAAYLRNE